MKPAALGLAACLAVGVSTACPADDMRVDGMRQQREIGLDDGVAPRQAIGASTRERWRASLEGHSECRRILTSDAVAVGRETHRLEERHIRFARDILRVGPP